MIREIVFLLLSLTFGTVESILWKRKEYNNRRSRRISFAFLLFIETIEIAYFIIYMTGYRLPNRWFCAFSILCLMMNAVYIVFNRLDRKSVV